MLVQLSDLGGLLPQLPPPWLRSCSELITNPTRITPSNSTLIEHIYTTLSLDKGTPGILINNYSGHLHIFVSIKSDHVEKVNWPTKTQFKHGCLNFIEEQFMDEIKETLNSMIINLDQCTSREVPQTLGFCRTCSGVP